MHPLRLPPLFATNCSHTFNVLQMMKLKDIALKEAEAKVFSLKEMTERASLLEADLAAAQNMTSSLEGSLLETKSSLSELEGAVDSISLVPHEKPKKGLAKLKWLEEKLNELQMRAAYFERKSEDLILDMTTMSNERESVVNKLRDVVVACDQLEKKAAEDVLEIAALESEIKLLQASNLTMKDEILEHVKLQQDVKNAMMLLDFLREVCEWMMLINFENVNAYLICPRYWHLKAIYEDV